MKCEYLINQNSMIACNATPATLVTSPYGRTIHLCKAHNRIVEPIYKTISKLKQNDTTLKLFLVSIKYGHWLISAETAEQAENLARFGIHPAEEETASFYGDENEPATVKEIQVNNPGIHWHTYG